ncbi:hypothetical protein DVH05_024025 [Phytophthora capsici]|nr:hypothetical protein DVH05_024025 [Phytophthora capsici]
MHLTISPVVSTCCIGTAMNQLMKRRVSRRTGTSRSVLRWGRSSRSPLPKLNCSLLIESRKLELRQPSTTKTTPKDDVTRYFSFSGGGWLMVYMYGVCKALRELKADEKAKFIGTSAGCLSIVSLVLNSDFDAICDSVVNDYVPAARSTWKGPFKMRDYLIDAVTRHGNIHDMDKLHGKVTVVYTSLSSWVTRRVSHFKNPVHLLQTMIASCCATPLVGWPFEHEGEYVIDGGLLDNQPLFEGVRTITVTPNVFSNADIRPSRYVPPWWSMYPPSERDMQWLFDLGYEDGLNWCKRQGFPGSESIDIPTKAAEYDGEWKTVIGQVTGYRSIEDLVLATAELLLLSEESIMCNVVRMELLLWKLVAMVAVVLDRVTVIWCFLAGWLLLTLMLLEQQCTMEFVLLLGGHLALAAMKIKTGCSQVQSSDKWRLLQRAVVATETRMTSGKHGPTSQQHELLKEHSYVYRLGSFLV